MSGFKLDIDSVERDEDRVEFLSACSKLDHGALRHLIDVKGVDVGAAKDDLGQNALHFVSTSSTYDTERQISLIGYLIQEGANVNQQRTSDGWTPLFLAVTFGLSQIVSALLQSGAKTRVKDHEGLTPEDYADMYRMKNIKDLLVHSRSKVPHSRFSCVQQGPALEQPSTVAAAAASTSSTTSTPSHSASEASTTSASSASGSQDQDSSVAAATAAATSTPAVETTEGCLLTAQ